MGEYRNWVKSWDTAGKRKGWGLRLRVEPPKLSTPPAAVTLLESNSTLGVTFPELPALVPMKESEEQMHAAQPLSLSEVMGPAQEAIQWFWLVKLYNFLESRP